MRTAFNRIIYSVCTSLVVLSISHAAQAQGSSCKAGETWLEEHKVCANTIQTAEDFLALRDQWNKSGASTFAKGKKPAAFYLANSIDLGTQENWVGIGSKNKPFTGIFSGGNNIITGQLESSDSLGIFTYTKNATIENLHTSASLIFHATESAMTNVYVGGIVASMTGGVLRRSSNLGSVTATNATGVGGLVGRMAQATIHDCHNEATLNVDGAGYFNEYKKEISRGGYIGGIVGYVGRVKYLIVDQSSIYNVSSIVRIQFVEDIVVVGGVVGSSTADLELYNVQAGGDIVGTPRAATNGHVRVGGIAGRGGAMSGGRAKFHNLSSSVNVLIDVDQSLVGAGGIVGEMNSLYFKGPKLQKSVINKAIYQGNITVDSYFYNRVGGIAGSLGATDVLNVLAIGNIHSESRNFNKPGFRGGIAGDTTSASTISNVASLMSFDNTGASGIAHQLDKTVVMNTFVAPLSGADLGIADNIDLSTDKYNTVEQASRISSSYYSGSTNAIDSKGNKPSVSATTYSVMDGRCVSSEGKAVVDQLNQYLQDKVKTLPPNDYSPWIEYTLDGVAYPIPAWVLQLN